MVERRAVVWLPAAAPATPFPQLASCRTVAAIGGAPPHGDNLIAAMAEHGLPLSEADAANADVIVLLHGYVDASLHTAFAELTHLAARASRPSILVGVASDTPEGAAFMGLIKTAALEWSAAWKCITLDGRIQSDQHVALELARGGADREVRVGGGRAVRVRMPESLRGEQRALTGGVWVVSGGARGVTAACCLALAQAGARRIALLGRTAIDPEPAACRDAADEASLKRVLIEHAGVTPSLPAIGRQARAILASREIRTTLATIEAAGAKVRYDSIDVTDGDGVRDVIADLRRSWGPIRGLVHAAGVLADKRLGEKALEQFDTVLRTKLAGARVLLDACAEDRLEQICFFSSVAAHAGNPGQSDYAAGNAALDRVAVDEQSRRGAACHVVSIAWGPWEGGMVGAALARHFAAQGIGLIPLKAGARAFVDELRRGDSVQVILGSGLRERGETESRRYGFDIGRLPMLRDHRIADATVLPMAFAIDTLFSEGRRGLGRNCEARDIRLLNGVVFAGERVEVDVRSETARNNGRLVTLLQASGRPAYRAELIACEGLAPARFHLSRGAADLPEPCRSPYVDALFHGPAFRVIREILTCTDTAISARLATAGAMGWPAGWQIDPAALDGALQLLRLWGFARDGRPSLPTAIARCRPWAQWPASGEIGCAVSCRRDNVHAISGDAVFVDLDSGDPLLSLDGLVMHMQA